MTNLHPKVLLIGPTPRPCALCASGLLNVVNDATKQPKTDEMRPWFRVTNEGSATEAAEIQIYDRIGRGVWDESGISDRDFAAALNAIPRGREITLRINSPGGSVKDGLAIYNRIAERRNDVTAVVDGVAASVASWLALSGKKVVMSQNAMMMIHNPMTVVAGDAAELRKAAEFLDTNKSIIVGMYRTKTGKSEKAIADAMDEETWFTANDAKAWGLADEVINGGMASNIQNTFDLSCFRRVPEALTKLAATPPENTPTNSAQKGSGANDSNTMTKEQIIALLKEQGITVSNEATIEQLQDMLKTALAVKRQEPENKQTVPDASSEVAKLTKALETLTNSFNALQAKDAENRKKEIGAELDRLVENNQMGANEREGWLDLCINDTTGKTLANLKARPVVMPGAEPVSNAVPVEITNASPADIAKAIKRFQEPSNSFCRGNDGLAVAIAQNSIAFGRFFAKNRARLLEVLNANTIDAALQRNVILQEVVRAFAKVLAPLRGFATNFNNVPLEGNSTAAKITVPYFPLATAASTDFVTANGYVMGDSVQNGKEITIDKRKYQPIRFTSDEIRRVPSLNLGQIALIKAEKLAIDVWQNILSVVTLANYGAAAKVEGAATFDLDDVADIRTVCNQANWPQTGRTLILDSAYDGNLFKQDGLQRANEFGSRDVIDLGAITRLMGFNYYQSPNIPANAQNLTGFAGFQSAILVGVSPIQPADEVRRQLTSYQVVTEPDTGIGFEYRLWGNPDMDERREVIEANYGFAAGETAAIKRITSA